MNFQINKPWTSKKLIRHGSSISVEITSWVMVQYNVSMGIGPNQQLKESQRGTLRVRLFKINVFDVNNLV